MKAAQAEPAVPATLQDVLSVFFSHPSAYIPSAAILGCACLRLGCEQPLMLADAAVATAVVAFWLVQEWLVHKWLLHSEFEWMGKTIHQQHHQQPYHHVSLDPPGLIAGVMALAAAVFAVLFRAGPLSLTGMIGYFSAGLLYEFLHYVVHTRWVPPAGWLRAVRRHHMLHHMRNEGFWLSFTAPAVDALFGTLPASGSSVPLTDMARQAHGAAAAALAGEGSSSRPAVGSSSNSSKAAGPAGGAGSVCVPAAAGAVRLR